MDGDLGDFRQGIKNLTMCAQIPSMKEKLTTLTEDVRKIKTELNEHDAALSTHEEEIRQLRNEVDTLTKTVEDLTTQPHNQKLNEEVSAIKRDLVQLEAMGSNLYDKYTSLYLQRLG